MGFWEKAISVGSSMYERAERQREDIQKQYDYYSSSARGKSYDELKQEYNSTDNLIKKSAIASEVKRRKGE